DWPFEQAFAFARECGYTGIEIAPFTIHPDVRQISSARRTEVRRQAEAADLPVIGLHWLLAKAQGLHRTSPDAEVRRRASDYVCERRRLWRALGGSFLVSGSPLQRNLPPGVSQDQGMDFAAEVFSAILPELEANEVTLLVEPLGPAEGDFLVTTDEG